MTGASVGGRVGVRATTVTALLDVVVAASGPVALYLSSSPLGWIAPIAVGLACAAARPMVAQTLRPAVRRVLFERACGQSLSAHRALPEQAAQDVAITVALAERALLSDVPRGVAALVAGLIALTLGCSLLGVAPATVLALCAVAYLWLRLPLARRLGMATASTFERRVVWTSRIAAAARNDGEIRSATQKQAFLAAGSREADSLTRAETAELGLVIAHRALSAALTLIAVTVVVFVLEHTSLAALSTASIASLRGVFLFVAAASQLGIAASSAVEVRRIRQEIAQRGTFSETEAKLGAIAVPHPTVLEARDLVVQLGGRTALGPLSFVLELKGLTAIAGPNGAGKSTLARTIAGILSPTSGSLMLDGVACAELAPETIAVVPQNPIVLESSSVEHNLALVASDLGRARQMLTVLGLDVELDRVAGELSRGEARRVAVARGLLTEAPILLLDESDAWLDGRTRRALVSALRAQADQRAILIISHREEIFRACDRVLLLDREHRVAGIGTVDELLERSPAMREVLDASESTP